MVRCVAVYRSVDDGLGLTPYTHRSLLTGAPTATYHAIRTPTSDSRPRGRREAGRWAASHMKCNVMSLNGRNYFSQMCCNFIHCFE